MKMWLAIVWGVFAAYLYVDAKMNRKELSLHSHTAVVCSVVCSASV
jgi:hypothetical protein